MEKLAAKADLERGRLCYDRREWRDAFEALSRAEQSAPLAPPDLDRLAWSAALTGHDEAFLSALERLHHAYAEAHETARAARAAFWIGFRLLSLGAPGRATGWLARASRLVEGEGNPCVERGYLLLPAVFHYLGTGENPEAEAAASKAAHIGERCGDLDLIALARNLEGRALLRQGKGDRGLALLDEVMVAVTSGELSSLVRGIVYCNVLATCREVCALDRAREWTAALARWCHEQPQLLTFTGYCLVHRAEIIQLAGHWREAMEALRQVCEGPRKDADPEVLGEACYQRAEILRLRGEFVEAEATYRLASQHGREPQPGFALLRLAQGQTEAAVNTVRRAVSTTGATWQRAHLLPAVIEIMLAAGEVEEARRASDELDAIARGLGTDALMASAAHAHGAVALAQADCQAAIEPLRNARSLWRKVGAPYVIARARVLLGRAFRELGDDDGAELEFAAARQVFEQLGAAPDLAALGTLGVARTRSANLALSPRELQVLRLLASGKTNKAIARELRVSDRTIDRHLSNIFAKIGVNTRTAATAFAYEHRLV